MDIHAIVKTIGRAVSKHSPEILTAVGTVGLVAAGVMTVSETAKALEIIKKYEERVDTEEPITVTEKIKLCWKVYLPSVIMASTSIASIIFARRIDSKRMAAWAAAYQMSETAINRLEQAVKDEYGDKKLEKVKNNADLKVLEEHPIEPSEIIETGDGDDLFCDYYSGRYFRSTPDAVQARYNNFIKKLLREDNLSPNDWLYFLSIPRMGDDVGEGRYFTSAQYQNGELWDTPQMTYGPGYLGKPCAVVKLSCKPINEY